ncbi:hypothetical protein KFK09_000606 [Dendrobium nobile]|uniref:Uncharacterized protein n=1 Tax=Dendrobium nobile TaxID=94219 RepID=A0A8T3CBK7_DENNO|nr:hypothetical protein KFK09_000606 [Dendrobium nobile]
MRFSVGDALGDLSCGIKTNTADLDRDHGTTIILIFNSHLSLAIRPRPAISAKYFRQIK